MKCKVVALGLMLVMALSLTRCGSKDTSAMSGPVGAREPAEAIGEEGAPPTGRIAFHVRYVFPSGRLAKSAAVDRMTAYVYKPDGTKITQADLEKVGDRGKASIAVVAGTDRRVDLVAYDGSLVEWTGSDVDVDAVAGQTTTADITMESTIPVLADLPDTNTTGSYTVSWRPVSGGTVYALQENGTGVYTGADTSVGMADQEDGSYAYRVKATIGGYGDSPWCDAVSLAVKLPPPEGTIDIDVPWPVDGEQPQTGEVTTFTLPGGATLEMVWIEPGTFVMGSPSSEPDRDSDESPQHQVTITKGFWLAKYEITEEQWESVLGTKATNPSYPKAYVTWNDAQAFVAKLNEAEESEVYRLPTEAEWEYACRAGTTTRWSFGDGESQLAQHAWYNGGSVHEVGQKLPNPWGLYDMSGNVFEWCEDWYGAYTIDSKIDPTGPVSGSQRISRGGGFRSAARLTRSAERHPKPPDNWLNDFGARLVRQGL